MKKATKEAEQDYSGVSLNAWIFLIMYVLLAKVEIAFKGKRTQFAILQVHVWAKGPVPGQSAYIYLCPSLCSGHNNSTCCAPKMFKHLVCIPFSERC
jgi:hypothetical protein